MNKPLKISQFVGYYRVSTQKQGQSGLGLDAQQTAVQNYVSVNNGELIASFTEIESGKNNARPELEKALKLCRETNVTLLIAKLDRLSRNLTFISNLMDSRLKFKALDIPEADNFTVHIIAALAQKERELISQRTKVALAERKKQGKKLGSPQNFTPEIQQKGRKIQRENAKNAPANQQARELIQFYWQQNRTLSAIARRLNELNYATRRGKTFRPTTVKRLIVSLSQ